MAFHTFSAGADVDALPWHDPRHVPSATLLPATAITSS